MTKNTVDVFFHLALILILGYGYLFHQKTTGSVQHFSLTKGEFLIFTKDEEITQNLSQFEHGASLDLIHILTIASVPGLIVCSPTP